MGESGEQDKPVSDAGDDFEICTVRELRGPQGEFLGRQVKVGETVYPPRMVKPSPPDAE